jgi:hypothetical protein
MSALAAIHQFWSSNGTLTALVPADRVYSGSPPLKDENNNPITRPYVSIMVESESDVQRTSSGRQVYREQLKVSTWHDSYDKAVEIDAVIRDQFNRRDFRFDRGRVLDIKCNERADTQDSDTLVWQIARTFNVLIDLLPDRVLV